MKNEKKKKETEQAMRLAAHLYCVNLLNMLLEIGVITEEERDELQQQLLLFFSDSSICCSVRIHIRTRRRHPAAL